MYKYLIGVPLIFLITITIIISFKDSDIICKSKSGVLKIEDRVFNVSIADNEKLRELGLSLHPRLKDNEGMLFVFENNIIPSFWMKDMLFPLHIFWIDENLKIISIDKNVLPESYPATYKPKAEIRYVLEIPTSSYDNPDNMIDSIVNFKCRN